MTETSAQAALFETNFPGIKIFRRGKVRDVYEFEKNLLIVASDRISAFDVIMSEPVPGKGKILSRISKFWFDRTRHIIRNHFVTDNVSEYPEEVQGYREQLEGRSMLVEKTMPLPVECVVRGYLAGSGWKEYRQSRTVCGIELPEGLQESSKLPEPIFTPAIKAESGHDENIPFEVAAEMCGRETAEKVREISLALYEFARNFVEGKGIILADTKFEFGIMPDGEIILIDEALTPDSSRYWLAEDYEPGRPQMNFDKQVLRDYLETIDWDKTPPAPALPVDIIRRTLEKYQEAMRRIID